MADKLLKFPYERTPAEKLVDAERCYRHGFTRGLLFGFVLGFGAALTGLVALLFR